MEKEESEHQKLVKRMEAERKKAEEERIKENATSIELLKEAYKYTVENKWKQHPKFIGRVLSQWDFPNVLKADTLIYPCSSEFNGWNRLHEVPSCVETFTNITILNLRDNKIKKVDPAIGKLKNLTELYLDSGAGHYENHSNAITELPSTIGNLINLRKLYLSNNNLLRLPREIGQCESLQILWINNNMLLTLPDELGEIVSLSKVYANDNLLTSLPSTFGRAINLTTLHVQNNALFTYPPPDVIARGLKAITDYMIQFPQQQSATLASDLSSLIDAPDFSDLIFIIDGVTIHAHQAILSVRCHNLQTLQEEKMFEIEEHNDKTYSKKIVKISGHPKINPQSFHSFLQFVYAESLKSEQVAGAQPILKLFGVAHSGDAHFVCPKENETLSDDMQHLYLDEETADVHFRFDDGSKLPAHKAILCCRTQYFRAMFQTGMMESTKSEIELAGTEKKAFENVLHFTYCGNTDAERHVDPDSIIENMITANQFGADQYQRHLEAIVSDSIDLDNAIELLKIAHQYQLQSLLNRLEDFICKHKDLLLDDPERKKAYSELPPEYEERINKLSQSIKQLQNQPVWTPNGVSTVAATKPASPSKWTSPEAPSPIPWSQEREQAAYDAAYDSWSANEPQRMNAPASNSLTNSPTPKNNNDKKGCILS